MKVIVRISDEDGVPLEEFPVEADAQTLHQAGLVDAEIAVAILIKEVIERTQYLRALPKGAT